MSDNLLIGLIVFFLVGAVMSCVKKDVPMTCYFAGAAMLNLGVLIK